jgi:membrane protease YdiL (CAAX protease family)
MSGSKLVWVTVLFESFLLALAFGLGHFAGVSPLANLEMSGKAFLSGTGLGLLMIAALLALVHIPWAPLERLREKLEGPVAGLFTGQTILGLTIMSAMAGVCEEVFFRGFLQGAVTARAGIWAGLGLASLAFGLAHAISLVYAIYAGVMGALFGVSYLLAGNLLVPVVAHAVFDLIGLWWLVRVRPTQTAHGS